VEELVVFRELLAVQRNSKARAPRHGQAARFVSHLPARDHIVFEVVIVRIGGEGQVWNDRAQMQHGRELNPELSRGMNGDA